MEAVLRKIRDQHLRIDTAQVNRRLETTRLHTSGEVLLNHLARWAQLVADNDIAGVHAAVSGDSDDAAEMRNLSPLGVLLAEAERQAVVRLAVKAEQSHVRRTMNKSTGLD